MALVPESAPAKAALFHGRWFRVFILVLLLLGGFFAVVYFGQPHSPPVEASASGRKVNLPPAQLPPVPPRVAGTTYLQLSATRRQSAELMVDDLRKKNFEAVASEIDGKPGVFRVLVGPVSNTEVVQLRADLERAGFPGNAAVRRNSAESSPPKPDNQPVAEPYFESDPAKPDVVTPLPVEATKAGATNGPVAGQAYLEFSATSPQTAEIIADELHAKGFDATASGTEEFPGVFRVLVRPVNDTSIDQLRADLERAGFHGNAATLRISK